MFLYNIDLCISVCSWILLKNYVLWDRPHLSKCLTCHNVLFAATSSLKGFALSLRNVLREVDSNKTLEEVLLNPDIPLRTPHVIKDLQLFWSSLQESISGFQSVVHSADDNLADAAYLKLTSCVVTGQGTLLFFTLLWSKSCTVLTILWIELLKFGVLVSQILLKVMLLTFLLT